MKLFSLLCGVLFQLLALPSIGQGDWTDHAPLPLARENHGSCVADGQIYVFGGASEHIPEAPMEARTDRYDLSSDAWSSRRDMIFVRTNHTAHAIEDKCYVLGGRSATVYRKIEVYDPELNSWSSRADAPFDMNRHMSAVLDGKIYVANGDGRLAVYDPANNSWKQLADMPTERIFGAAATIGGKMYFTGGTETFLEPRLNTVEVYDPTSGSWSEVSPMPRGLVGHAACAVGNALWVSGGTNDDFDVSRKIFIYDPVSDEWSEGPELPGVRNWHSCELTGGRLFLIGGGQEASGFPHRTMDSMISWPAGDGDPDPFFINSGLNDAWYNPATSGQGFLISVFPEIQQMFLAWFTFDIERPPEDVTAMLGDPGHRWLTAQGPYDGDTANLTIFVTEGGVFDSEEPATSTDPDGDGTMTLEFADCTEGLVNYEITSLGISGEIPIQRIVQDNVPLCEALANP
jgi:N-acetylneuraminic acid mutarotase